MSLTRLYLKPWFDAHAHLRSASSPWTTAAFDLIVQATAAQCKDAVIMPNSPVIKTVDQMHNYRQTIIESATRTGNPDFYPLMTLYLMPDTPREEVQRAAEIPWFAGWKLYPQGVTTGSSSGIDDLRRLELVLRWVGETDSRLLIHGEKPGVDVQLSERQFVLEDLPIVRQMFSGKICLEHCSTQEAIDAVLADELMWGSITPHHLTGDFSQMSLSSFNFCKPVWPTIDNRRALVKSLARSPQTKFFAGSDTAPHPKSVKTTKQAFGCFSAPVALPRYMAAFVEAQLDTQQVGNFLFENAANFYGISTADWQISTDEFAEYSMLVAPSILPTAPAVEYRFGRDSIVPPRAYGSVHYAVSFRS